MIVCRKLGYRYLWIDALCMVMDDTDDVGREIQKIGTYLTSADIVFVASSANMNESLMPAKHEAVLKTFRAHLEHDVDDRFTIGVREPLQSAKEILDQSILNRRWRIQEAVLPKRLLIFGKEQLHWVCQQNLASQSTAVRRMAPLTTFPSIAERLQNLNKVQSEDVAKDLAHDYWYYVAEMSSRGKLTRAQHALPSIDHIASNIQRLTQGVYCAGLWLEDLVHGLLWIKQAPCMLSHHGESRTAPSWSWASETAPISYALVAGLKAFERTSKELPRPIESLANNVEGSVPSNIRLFALVHALLAAFNTMIISLLEIFQQIVSESQRLLTRPKDDLLLKFVDCEMLTNQARDQQDQTSSLWDSADYRLSSSVSLRVSACTQRADLSHSASLDRFEYFFDHEFGFGRDVKVADLTFIAVSPWKYTLEGDARWAGLMLEKVDADSETYERRGVFIGPPVEEQLQGWERKIITLI